MKKNHFSIALIVFFSCFLFACGKAPNTVKVLRSMNNATANYWVDLVQKHGVNYVDYDGESILALALEAKNATLLQAIIKDGADLYRRYKNSNGVEKYPLDFVILSTDPYYNQFASWELAKILVDAGTKLQYPEGFDILLQALGHGNAELIDLLLPGFKKQKLLNYSNFKNTADLRGILGWILVDEGNMTAIFNKLAEAGMKLPKDMVEDYITRIKKYPDDPVLFESVLKMADLQKRDAEAIISRPKTFYIAVMSPIKSRSYTNWLIKDPDSQERDNSIRYIEIGEKFEFLETGKEDTLNGITAPWFKVRTENGWMTAWIFSGFFRDESTIHYVTTSNVNIRDEDNTTGYLLTVLSEGTAVELWEVGKTDSIDGITAPWYRIKTADGTIGWVFSGDLSEAGE